MLEDKNAIIYYDHQNQIKEHYLQMVLSLTIVALNAKLWGLGW